MVDQLSSFEEVRGLILFWRELCFRLLKTLQIPFVKIYFSVSGQFSDQNFAVGEPIILDNSNLEICSSLPLSLSLLFSFSLSLSLSLSLPLPPSRTEKWSFRTKTKWWMLLHLHPEFWPKTISRGRFLERLLAVFVEIKTMIRVQVAGGQLEGNSAHYLGSDETGDRLNVSIFDVNG